MGIPFKYYQLEKVALRVTADKASRLFQYLSEVEKLKEKKKILSTSEFAKTGTVLWLSELAPFSRSGLTKLSFGLQLSEAFKLPGYSSDDSDDLVFSAPRASAVPFPALEEALKPFLSNDGSKFESRPELQFPEDFEPVPGESSVDEIRRKSNIWLSRWDRWAENERYKKLYQDLFDLYTKSTQQSDEFELILGLGNLNWKLPDGKTINRPIFNVKLSANMDKHTGEIRISLDTEEIAAELDVIPPEFLSDSQFISDVKTELELVEGPILDPATFEELGNLTAMSLSIDAEYVGSLERQAPSTHPTLAWAPVIILRHRRRAGLIHSFGNIAEKILGTGEIPDGLKALIDPNQQAAISGSGAKGALFVNDGDIFSPLPLNDRQKEVLKRVDTHAQTIVQGPPGTGKTHMAAALLSNLLAQGKRVLVTAETDRALYELRGKMPEEIQELAVSVIGSGETDMADLKVSVDTISRKSSEFDQERSDTEISQLNWKLNQLGEQRVRKMREWADRMESESTSIGVEDYGTNLAQALEKWKEGKEQHSWIRDIKDADLTKPFPLSRDEIEQWLDLLGNVSLRDHKALRRADAIDLTRIPNADEFDRMCKSLAGAKSEYESLTAKMSRKKADHWSQQTEETRDAVRTTVERAVALSEQLHREDWPWSAELFGEDNRFGISSAKKRAEMLHTKLEEARNLAAGLSRTRRIVVQGNHEELLPMAKKLIEFLSAGKTIKTNIDGTVKIGMFAPSIVRQAVPFFDAVKIDGLAPTTVDQLQKFILHVELHWVLEDLQKGWPHFGVVEAEDGPLRVESYSDLIDAYSRSVETASELARDLEKLGDHGFRVDHKSVVDLPVELRKFERAASARKTIVEVEGTFNALNKSVKSLTSNFPDLLWPGQLMGAIDSRNQSKFKSVLERAGRAATLASDSRTLEQLSLKMQKWSQDLSHQVARDSAIELWWQRVRGAENARKWALADQKIRIRDTQSIDTLQQEIAVLEKELTATVSALSAARAWAKAVGGSRIDPQMRSNLVAYSQAVRRLGKGTGKYADQQRREIRQQLDQCRAAVPVWIMPIYKVVDQFQLEENMFDVVIVDEASQAGVDSIFLQYLAPRIVVIGDNMQVSPSAVGRDREPIKKLARQYLYDFNDVASWTDPKRSLFDDAEMRYGGRIVLDEHRRCVPEIIEFSNQLVYRPNKIELKPVREILPGRLAPFRVTQTPNAAQSPTQKKLVNTVEADVLIARLEACLKDPAYDGKSFGVISLLSTSGQADYIQNRLLEKLSPEVWEDRDLKVGSPAEFQGAERDVIFLSMVAMADPGKRTQPLTGDTYIQRYNVAVSRAKDQIWLFHSARIEQFGNPEDVRAKLLQYAYEVAEAEPEIHGSEPVSNDQRVEPFDSLFEQRVYNDIVLRGYRVEPQLEAFGYHLDLVVQGEGGRIAVECDGDHWHGPDRAKADQARQRELERLGWSFVRIFESDYYLDRDAQLERLFTALEEKGIEPYSSASSCKSSDTSVNVEVIDEFYGDDLISAGHLPEEDLEVVEEEQALPSVADEVIIPVEASIGSGSGSEEDFEEYEEIEEYEDTEEGEAEEVEDENTVLPLTPRKRPQSPNPAVPKNPRREDNIRVQSQGLGKNTIGQTAFDLEYGDEERHVSRANSTSDVPVSDSARIQPRAPMSTMKLDSRLPELDPVFDQPYREFSGKCVPLDVASAEQIEDGLRKIVEVEGPIVGDLLISRYVQKSGGKPSKSARTKLNRAIGRLVSRKAIMADNPMDFPGYKKVTFYIPGRDPVVIRNRGTRSLENVPFRELTAVMKYLKDIRKIAVPEQILQKTLKLYDHPWMTDRYRKILEEPFYSLFEK